jgi:hypothetical protein
VANQRHIRTLIYKRTHEGDPDESTGVFGNGKCMGQVRSWKFKAVIGVGGIRPWAKHKGIARKLTWMGIGTHTDRKDRKGNPLVTFDHFLYYGKEGRLLEEVAPKLASHMYDKGARVLMNLSSAEQREVDQILDCARDAPPSGHLKGVHQRKVQETRGTCETSSCRG